MKLTISLFSLIIVGTTCIFAQEATKKGWSVTPLPVVAYETDLGFQYGAMCDIYYYGDGSSYPGYEHKLFVEAAYSTKNSGLFYAYYDSEHLIEGLRVTAVASFVPEMMHNFYGYNGYASGYFPGYNRNRQEKIAYYNIDYKQIRAFVDLQGAIAGDLKWAAGITYMNYMLDDVALDPYKGCRTLYGDYIRSGLIREDEANGGSHLEFKAGLVYDTRNHDAAPDRGIWAEALVYGSADVFSTGYKYLKAAVRLRHYVTLVRDRLVLAWHAGYQGTIAGEAPFYIQPNITNLLPSKPVSEGLGSSNTLRGIFYNRILGDSYAWGNLELRLKLWSFRLIGQEWYLAVNPFLDAGMAVVPFRIAEQKEAAQRYSDLVYPDGTSVLYSGNGDSMHYCAGIGGKVVMNYNFVLSAEIGKALDPRDGEYMLCLGLNYIF